MDLPQLSGLALAVLAAMAALPSAAAAQAAWTASEFEARITLPAPQPGSQVTGATMSCAEQVWTLTLLTEPGAGILVTEGTATLTVPRETFEAPAKAVAGGLEITVPHRALEPLKAATRLAIGLPGGTQEVRFSLAGSRRAITAAEVRCTQRPMPLANSVPLTRYSSYLLLARELRRSDIADFVLSTASQPSLRAGMVEIGDGHRLLFAELCGSTWYYGVSGCNLAGYAPVEGGDPRQPEGWRPVYETEGVFLYVDPNAASDGWPDLVAIPAKAGTEEMRWRWTGDGYGFVDPDVAGETAEEEADGRP